MFDSRIVDYFKGMSTEDLIDEAKSLYECIALIGSFGVWDVLRLEFACQELKRRGYALTKTIEVFQLEEETKT